MERSNGVTDLKEGHTNQSLSDLPCTLLERFISKALHLKNSHNKGSIYCCTQTAEVTQYMGPVRVLGKPISATWTCDLVF